MRMTAAMVILGSLLVYWASIFIIVILPIRTIKDKPSEIWRPMNTQEKAGLQLYVENGCSYCHSLYIRTNDWGHGAERISQPGDYYGIRTAILGTQRTGPDLSMEGGQRSDDWHTAHFANPRNTSPISVMPSFAFLGEEKIRNLTALMQSFGGKIADRRQQRQKEWKRQAVAAHEGGSEENIQWLHNQVPPVWRPMPNPYPASTESLRRGRRIYQEFCIGCHGILGDGNGPAGRFLRPPPLNFTILGKHLLDKRYIGGLFYYQIMNGITGTAMPYFKRHLESEKIWDVSNFIAVNFVGYTDANLDPRGIDAAYELDHKEVFSPPGADSTLLRRFR